MRRSLSILVVDDKDVKIKEISDLIEREFFDLDISIDHAECFATGTAKLHKRRYDLVLLDLLLPMSQGKTPQLECSLSFIDFARSGNVLVPGHIIGLTEERRALEEAYEVFSGQLMSIIAMERKGDWESKLIRKLEYLIESYKSAQTFFENSFLTDVIILTARFKSEYIPLINALNWDGTPVEDKSVLALHECRRGEVKVSPDRSVGVRVVCMNSMGVAECAARTMELLMRHRPRLIAMVGMCCGFRDRNMHLGDTVIVSQSALSEEGKLRSVSERRPDTREKISTKDKLNVEIKSELDIRTKPISAPASVVQMIDNMLEISRDELVARQLDYIKRNNLEALMNNYGDEFRREPDVIAGQNVSGNCIIADRKKMEEILKNNPYARSLEMEIHGLYTAARAYSGRDPDFIAMKGVADFGEEKGGGINYDPIQSVATGLAATAFQVFLEHYFAADKK